DYIPQSHRDRFNSVEYIQHYLKRLKQPPSLILSPFFLGAEENFLKLLDRKSIPFFSLNTNVSREQYSLLGKPRERFPLWIGHMSPNDVLVGERLAEALLHHFRIDKNCSQEDCNANFYGFTGLPFAAVSKQRAQGVEAVIQQDKSSRSYNIVSADWRRNIVREKMKAVLYRHKDIDIFWAASDTMAWGIIDGINANKYTHRTLVGGVDWAPESIQYIKNGDMDLSLGGHFLEAGLALILFYDYLNGVDFAKSHGVIIETKLSELNQKNVDTLGRFLEAPKWNKAVLRQYSKFNNPIRKNYVFDPKTLISQQLK
ncbi:substrate-binding domain-containing protein, partial [Paraglaciecola sp.]|uniref:substrate-binding domain-containing protein n=1 Tax=Paraglaciecola sp. TaxID=1920173 RepID=UPI003EF746FC